MQVFEDYASPAEKRAAQKGAKLGKPTGKARGYIFVFNENGWTPTGNRDCVASVFDVEPGCDDPKGNLCSTGVSQEYLRTRCRRVGGCHLPPKWKERWNYYRTPEPVGA